MSGEAFDQLISVNAANLSLDELEHWADVANRLRSQIEVAVSRLLSRVSQLHTQGSAIDAPMFAQTAGRLTRKEARATAERSRTLHEMSPLADRLAAGTIATSHVDAIAAATARLTDEQRQIVGERIDELVAVAEITPPDLYPRFVRNIVEQSVEDATLDRHERQRRETKLRKWHDKHSGMFHIHGQFDPENGSRLFAAIDAAANSIRHDQSALPMGERLDDEQVDALALVQLATGAQRSDSQSAAEVIVLIDLATLTDGIHDTSVCELSNGTQIPAHSARRILCNAAVIPAALGTNGELLDLGRSHRQANRAQRRALRVEYATCAFPDCTVTFDRCEIHHVDWFEHGGRTDLANLVPLCSRHHHLCHEGRWRLTIDHRRTITVHRPDNQHHATRRHHPTYAPHSRPSPHRGRSSPSRAA